ncbi:MFS transporter [Loigolactobacillus coryniformis]|uniref:MFS transporter n=1 Tax=Loigolactobacillus coryniformis TaxID=1610 RepID=UPI00345C6272
MDKINATTKKQSFFVTAIGIYICYAVLSMAQIIISQYSSFFQNSWQTDLHGISTVISMMGIGRILTILFAGYFSDKLGRKPVLLVGMACTVVFFLGLIFSTNVFMACIFSLFLGFTNSFGDAAAYPALSEAFPEKSASMNSLVKAAMSLAQFVLPFVVAAIPNAKITLWMLIAMIVIDILIVLASKFAPQVVTQPAPEKSTKNETSITNVNVGPKPNMRVDGAALIVLGFTISFTFYVYTQYIPNFGTAVLGLDKNAAASLMSWYAIFSLVSVFVTSMMVTKIKPILLVILYPLISVIFLIALVIAPSPALAKITSAVIGFFAAGGVWQLGLAVITKYFPTEKGRVTGYYSFSAALTYFVGPFVSSFIINSTAGSVLKVFWIDIAFTIIGISLATFVEIRNRKYKFFD